MFFIMVDAEGLLKAQDTFFIIFKEKSLIRYILNYMKAFGTLKGIVICVVFNMRAIYILKRVVFLRPTFGGVFCDYNVH